MLAIGKCSVLGCLRIPAPRIDTYLLRGMYVCAFARPRNTDRISRYHGVAREREMFIAYEHAILSQDEMQRTIATSGTALGEIV